MAKKWTEKECKFLETHFEKMDNKELAEKFEVSPKAISSKLRSLNFKRDEVGAAKKTKAAKSVKAVKKTSAHKKAKSQIATRSVLHQNMRCRRCLIIDGYTQKEQKCRHCGERLFRDDVL